MSLLSETTWFFISLESVWLQLVKGRYINKKKTIPTLLFLLIMNFTILFWVFCTTGIPSVFRAVRCPESVFLLKRTWLIHSYLLQCSTNFELQSFSIKWIVVQVIWIYYSKCSWKEVRRSQFTKLKKKAGFCKQSWPAF